MFKITMQIQLMVMTYIRKIVFNKYYVLRILSIFLMLFLSGCNIYEVGTCFFNDFNVDDKGPTITTITNTHSATVRGDGNYSFDIVGCGKVPCSTVKTDPYYSDRCHPDPSTSGTKVCSVVPSAKDFDINCKAGDDGVHGTVNCTNQDSNCNLIPNTTGTMSCRLDKRAGDEYNQYCQKSDNCSKNIQNNDEDKSGQWIDTGMVVNDSMTLNVATKGNVYICGTYGVGENNGLGKKFRVNSRNYQWTDTQMYINPGDLFAIMVGEPNQQVNNSWVDICSSCTKDNCLPDCNRWATWNGTASTRSAPDAWDPTRIANNQVCSSPGCMSGSKANWNIRGTGLFGALVDPNASSVNPPSMPNTFDLMNKQNYNKESPQATIFQFIAGSQNTCDQDSNYTTATGSGTLKFRVWDCDDETNCYGDNMGGYTVYITQYACPGINGCSSVAYPPYGELQVLVTTKDPNKECITDSYHSTSDSCGQYLNNVNGDNKIKNTGNVWLRVNDSKYADNVGQYDVVLTSKTSIKGNGPWIGDGNIGQAGCDISSGYFSAVVCYVMNIVRNTLFSENGGAVPTIFNQMTCSDTTDKGRCLDYLASIRALLTLFIMFYAISFMFGLVQISQLDLVIRALKMGVILALTAPNSWKFFYDHFFNLFIDGSAELVNMMNGNGGSISNPFVFADHAMAMMLFSKTAVFRLIALLFTSYFGVIYLAMILYGIFIYISAMFKAVIVYMMAYVATGLLISLAPIFIPCILFGMTRQVFDNWLRYLAKYALEPVILLTGLSILTQILLTTVGMFGYAVCWKCAIPFKLGVPIPGVPSVSLFCLNFFGLWGIDNLGGSAGLLSSIIGMFSQIIFFIIIVKLIDQYGTFSQKIATILTNSLSAPAIGGPEGAASNMAKSLTEGAKSIVGMDRKSVQRRQRRNAIQEMAREELAQEKENENPQPKNNRNNTTDKQNTKPNTKPKNDGSGGNVTGIV